MKPTIYKKIRHKNSIILYNWSIIKLKKIGKDQQYVKVLLYPKFQAAKSNLLNQRYNSRFENVLVLVSKALLNSFRNVVENWDSLFLPLLMLKIIPPEFCTSSNLANIISNLQIKNKFYFTYSLKNFLHHLPENRVPGIQLVQYNSLTIHSLKGDTTPTSSVQRQPNTGSTLHACGHSYGKFHIKHFYKFYGTIISPNPWKIF